MLVSAATRLYPQSAIHRRQHRFRRSSLDLRGPRNGLEMGPRSSRGVRSVPLLAQIPNLPAKAGFEEV
eukprot:9737953-Alexandrium_andersonii.AAC.1